jgi:hypothetical protein
MGLDLFHSTPPESASNRSVRVDRLVKLGSYAASAALIAVRQAMTRYHNGMIAPLVVVVVQVNPPLDLLDRPNAPTSLAFSSRCFFADLHGWGRFLVAPWARRGGALRGRPADHTLTSTLSYRSHRYLSIRLGQGRSAEVMAKAKSHSLLLQV